MSLATARRYAAMELERGKTADGPLRVLFVAPYVPGRLRARPYHWLRFIARRGHRITLLCPANAADAPVLDELRPLCAQLITLPQPRSAVLANCADGWLRGLPLQAAHSAGAALRALARHTLHQQFDIVHVEHLRAAELGRAILAACPHTPLVFDAVDSISLLFERALRHSPAAKARLLALLDLARTRRYEARYRQRFAQVLVTSPEDHWALEVLRHHERLPAVGALDVLPNGVDLDYFRPGLAPRAPATLIFSGKLSYHANHASALMLLRDIMPRIWAQRPATQLQLVGADPPADLRAYAADPRITVTGFVPDLRPYLAQATLAICPLAYGVGIQNKVLEAMATATPVVAVGQATRALAAEAGRDLLVADDAAAYARLVVALLDDPARRMQLGSNGRRYVEQFHDWDQAAARLEGYYRQVCAAR
jgi:polysaccharide biosynthesis protein PslH